MRFSNASKFMLQAFPGVQLALAAKGQESWPRQVLMWGAPLLVQQAQHHLLQQLTLLGIPWQLPAGPFGGAMTPQQMVWGLPFQQPGPPVDGMHAVPSWASMPMLMQHSMAPAQPEHHGSSQHED